MKQTIDERLGCVDKNGWNGKLTNGIKAATSISWANIIATIQLITSCKEIRGEELFEASDWNNPTLNKTNANSIRYKERKYEQVGEKRGIIQIHQVWIGAAFGGWIKSRKRFRSKRYIGRILEGKRELEAANIEQRKMTKVKANRWISMAQPQTQRWFTKPMQQNVCGEGRNANMNES